MKYLIVKNHPCVAGMESPEFTKVRLIKTVFFITFSAIVSWGYPENEQKKVMKIYSSKNNAKYQDTVLIMNELQQLWGFLPRLLFHLPE